VAAKGGGLREPPLPPKPPDVAALLRPLIDHGVEFVLVGGMAGIAHGSSYPSYDLDVAYRRGPANVSRLVEALREIGVRLRGAPADLPFQLDHRTIENGANFTFVTEHGDFDVLGDVDGIRSYDELRAQAQEKQIDGLLVPVASLDHLIAMKRAASRTKDKLMLEEYIVIAEERRAAGPDQE
jgi:predicted nucleotidyltransferase